jgi:tetratricopeptide (TPR) repeat protein
MNIIQGINRLIYGLKSSWHLGRGQKQSNRGKHESALKHWQLSHDYSIRACDSEASIALRKESIAWALTQMKNYDEALEYANESRKIYTTFQGKGKSFNDALIRIDKIIQFINEQKSL